MSSAQGRRLPVSRGREVTVTLDGQPVTAYEGETLAAALLADRVGPFGHSRAGDPRAPLCNMGTCFECVLTVDGRPLVRSCLTPVVDGMAASRNRGY